MSERDCMSGVQYGERGHEERIKREGSKGRGREGMEGRMVGEEKGLGMG